MKKVKYIFRGKPSWKKKVKVKSIPRKNSLVYIDGQYYSIYEMIYREKYVVIELWKSALAALEDDKYGIKGFDDDRD